MVACRGGEFVHAELHLGLRACVQSAIVSKKEIPQCSLIHLGDCLESSLIDQFPMQSVAESDSCLAIMKGISEHHNEQGGSKGTPLLDSIGDGD